MFSVQHSSETKSHNSVEPCIPPALTNEDFMSFFGDKTIRNREEINQPQLPIAAGDSLVTFSFSNSNRRL